MKKIGILGGTFNPIHTGHLMLAEYARSEMELDEIWLIPTGCSYMKEESSIAPAKDRMDMVELAIGDNPHMKALDIEIIRAGNTYSYETLETLQQEYPEAELYFILGADCLFTIQKWRHPERIFGACTILAAMRNDSDPEGMEAQKQLLEQEYGAKVRLLSLPNIQISSTDIRERIRNGLSVKYFVPDRVLSYIDEKGLYK